MGDHIYTIQPPQNIINCPLRLKLGGLRELTALAETPSSVPSMHHGKFTTIYNSSFRGADGT